MSKGTIIYVGGFELPDKNAAAHRVLGNAKILRNLGYNVVFLGIDKSLRFDIPVLDTYKKVQNFDSWYIPYPKSNKQWLKYLSNIKPFIKVYNKYSDVKAVICYNYQSQAFIKLMKFCRLKGIKIIADCTEWYGIQGTNILRKIFKGIDSFVRMRIIQQKVDGIIVISKYLQEYYKRHKNVVLIPPLIDLKEDKWHVRKLENGNKDFIRLIYSGSPGYKKDKINKIIRGLYALKNSFNYEFNTIGITKEEYLKYYPEDKVIICELSNRVKFLGRMSHIESIQELSKADYSIFIRENNIVSRAGFPTKLVESISCGVPVITNNTSNITDYIKSGYNGFILDNDIVEGLKKIFY